MVLTSFGFTQLDAAPKKKGQIFFGPTGIVGEIKGKTIVVKEIQKNSPSDGVIKTGSVIIGVGNKNFNDPKKDIAHAVDQSEAKKSQGKMVLKIKGGKEAHIRLNVLGSYAPSAPYKCPKVDKIIQDTALQVAKHKKGKLYVELLALMATGERKHLDFVKKAIREGEWMKFDGGMLESYHCCTWHWSYRLIMLSEYYLLTKDRAVLPAMKSYAVTLAWGQDNRGLYGHKMSYPDQNFRLPGYGAMNQTTLAAFMGMLLAQKCGIKDPQLDKAIKVTGDYLRTYSWKGSFPYGGNGPQSAGFNNNGMSGMAAICMELMGDSQGAKFFAQCAATTYDKLEQGHASAYFNPLWTTLGAARSGPWVTKEYFKRIIPYHNLRRQHDGSWMPDWTPGSHDAVALLNYCIGRKKLIITGREMDESIWASKDQAQSVVSLSKMEMKGKSAQEVLDLAINHPMPQIRRKAGGALGAHREVMTPKYVQWLANGTTQQKMTAVGQYGWWIKPEVKLPHLKAIGKILSDPNEPMQLRKAAAISVINMGEPAQKYYMTILKLVDASDDIALGRELSKLYLHPFQKQGLVTDKEVLYRVASKLVVARDQKQRGAGFKMLLGMPLEDFHRFADSIDAVFKGDNPTWTSYSNPQHDVASAVKLLASLNIREGIDYALKVYDSRPIGKHSFRMKATWLALAAYGGNAKEALKKYHERWGIDKNYGRHKGFYLKMVKAIESDNSPPKLISMKEAIEAGKGK